MPYLHFHGLQALFLQFAICTGLALFSLFLWAVFRFSSAPGVWVGFIYVGLFALWLMAGMGGFLAVLVCAWRAGRGDVYKVPVLGDMAEHRVLAAMADADV